MIGIDTIYQLAHRDACTGSIPLKDTSGIYEFTSGQLQILNDKNYEDIMVNSARSKTLKRKRDEIFTDMLSKQSIADNDLATNDQKIVETEIKIEKMNPKIGSLRQEKLDEEELLSSRGYILPCEPNSKEEDLVDSKQMRDSSKIFKKYWLGIKKWAGVFAIIITLEAFFGLSLWDTMRDQKSIIHVILRIAASGLLVISLHMAEKRYKENKSRRYAGYIVMGIFSLIALLFGAIVLGYIYPEYLETNTISLDIFNLSSESDTQTSDSNRGWVGFFMRYDFFIAILCIIIFMLIRFLDTSIIKETLDENESVESTATANTNSIKPAISQFLYLCSKYNADLQSRKKYKKRLELLKHSPTILMIKVHSSLLNAKEAIEKMDEEILEKENKIDVLLRTLNANLNQYKIDFIDIFQSKPSASFVTVVWPTRDDILRYYNVL